VSHARRPARLGTERRQTTTRWNPQVVSQGLAIPIREQKDCYFRTKKTALRGSRNIGTKNKGGEIDNCKPTKPSEGVRRQEKTRGEPHGGMILTAWSSGKWGRRRKSHIARHKGPGTQENGIGGSLLEKELSHTRARDGITRK